MMNKSLLDSIKESSRVWCYGFRQASDG